MLCRNSQAQYVLAGPGFTYCAGDTLPPCDPLDWEMFAPQKVLPALFAKRGCALDFTFCPSRS